MAWLNDKMLDEKIDHCLPFLLSSTILLLLVLQNLSVMGMKDFSQWLRDNQEKFCDMQEAVKTFLDAFDRSLDAMKALSLALKSDGSKDSTPGDVPEESSVGSSDSDTQSETNSERSQRRKRFLGNSFNPENMIRNALSKLNLDQIFAKVLATLNFEEMVRKLNIPGMIEKSMGDIKKLIEQQLDLPNLFLNHLKKVDIDSFVNKLLAQLNISSLVKDKLNASNLEAILQDLFKHLDLKKLIETVLSKIDLSKAWQSLTNSIDIDRLIKKLLEINDEQSPVKQVIRLLKLDQLIEHLFDPQWILQRLFPDIDQTGIEQLIGDFHRTVHRIANGTENFQNILVKSTIEKGIPLLINILDPRSAEVVDNVYKSSASSASEALSTTTSSAEHDQVTENATSTDIK